MKNFAEIKKPSLILPGYLKANFENFKKEGDEKSLYVLLITWILNDNFDYSKFDTKTEEKSIMEMFRNYNILNEMEVSEMSDEQKRYYDFISVKVREISDEFIQLGSLYGLKLNIGRMFEFFDNNDLLDFNRSLEKAEISVRLLNLLKNAGILTYADLLKVGDTDFLKFVGSGKELLNNIKVHLRTTFKQEQWKHFAMLNGGNKNS